MDTQDPEPRESPANAVSELRAEIDEARELLDGMADQKELVVLKLYSEAKQKLIGSIALAGSILTIFGLYSIASFKADMRAIAETALTEVIEAELKDGLADDLKAAAVEELRDRLVEEHGTEIANRVFESLQERIQAQIEDTVRQDLERLGSSLADKQEPGSGERALADAIRESYGDLKYYVIAGSSPNQVDLQWLIREVRETTGDERFEALFPDVRICEPSNKNRNYAVVIGPGMEKEQADQMLKDARSWGFRSDSFLVRDTHFRPGCSRSVSPEG